MKQKFSKLQQKKFLDYFKARDKPGKIEYELLEKTYKYVNKIKKLPGLQMIAVGNSISMNSANKNSDIDLFIVSKNNTLWFVRIMITFLFQILGVRKTAKKHAGKFCLSFFSTHKGLEFSSWKLENDIYLYFWIIYLKPILNYNNTYEELLKANNKWANFNEYSKIIEENKKYIRYSGQKKGEKEKIIWKLNDLFKKLFLPKTLKHYKKLGEPFGVIINDDLLKFHDNDIRQKVKEAIL